MSGESEALDTIAAVLRERGAGRSAGDAIRGEVAGTGREVPSVRRFLDLSTAHIPPDVFDGLDSHPWVVADMTPFGAWLWVPSDPENAVECEQSPDAVVAVQRYARSLGCDWVLLDVDAPTVASLPTYCWT